MDKPWLYMSCVSNGYIQHPGRSGVANNIVQGILFGQAIAAATRRMAVRQKRQQAHAHQAEIVPCPNCLPAPDFAATIPGHDQGTPGFGA